MLAKMKSTNVCRVVRDSSLFWSSTSILTAFIGITNAHGPSHLSRQHEGLREVIRPKPGLSLLFQRLLQRAIVALAQWSQGSTFDTKYLQFESSL